MQKKEIACFINLHTVPSITNPSSRAHPRAPCGQYNLIDCPGASPCSVVGLYPSEPGPGRSSQRKHTWFVSKPPQKHKNIYFIPPSAFMCQTLGASSLLFEILYCHTMYWVIISSGSTDRRAENELCKYVIISFIQVSEPVSDGKVILNYQFIPFELHVEFSFFALRLLLLLRTGKEIKDDKHEGRIGILQSSCH